VLAVLTTPLITAGLAAVLLVLSVVAFAVKWLTADFSMPLGPQTLSLSSTVNGFGMQKLSGDLGSDSALSGQYLAFALVTLVLLAVGAVLVLLVPPAAQDRGTGRRRRRRRRIRLRSAHRRRRAGDGQERRPR
jgi:hypothetical protein